jgi:hypothetical protein
MDKNRLDKIIKEETAKVLNEASYKKYLNGLEIEWNGKERTVKDVEELANKDMINFTDGTSVMSDKLKAKKAKVTYWDRKSGQTIDVGTFDKEDTLPKLVKSAKLKGKQAWNKGQKTTSKRDYLKILKGAMKDARGMGDQEFTHDMATSMIYDPEIKSYLHKTYPSANQGMLIRRLQNDLEMFIEAKQQLANELNEDLPTKEVDPKEFPNPLPSNKKGFLKKGAPESDGGKAYDDVVPTKPVEIAVSKLKPSQDAIYLGKSLAMAINGVEGGDLGAVISKDNYILDGHHRYAATSFNNPSATVGGVQAQLEIGDLIPVLRAAGDAMKNKRGVEPKGGDVNIFKATMDDVKAVVYEGKNVPPQFYNKEKSVAWFEGHGEETIAKRLKQLQSKRPPSGAPARKDMPKIKPDQVNLIKNLLNKGKIDVRPPYANESIDNDTLNRIIQQTRHVRWLLNVDLKWMKKNGKHKLQWVVSMDV